MLVVEKGSRAGASGRRAECWLGRAWKVRCRFSDCQKQAQGCIRSLYMSLRMSRGRRSTYVPKVRSMFQKRLATRP